MKTVKQIAEQTGRTESDVNFFICKHYPEMKRIKGSKRKLNDVLAAEIANGIKAQRKRSKNHMFKELIVSGYDPVNISEIAVQYEVKSLDDALLILDKNKIKPLTSHRGRGYPVYYDRKEIEKVLNLKSNLPAPEFKFDFFKKKETKTEPVLTVQNQNEKLRFEMIKNYSLRIKSQLEYLEPELQKQLSDFSLKILDHLKFNLKGIFIEATETDGVDHKNEWDGING